MNYQPPKTDSFIYNPMPIFFEIGKSSFTVDCHAKLFAIMRIKKVKQLNAYVEWEDGVWLTDFQEMHDGVIAQGFRHKVE